MSFRYTGGDFMFFCTGSYAAAARAAAGAAAARAACAAAAGRRFCPHDNFWTPFRIAFIFGTFVGPNL